MTNASRPRATTPQDRLVLAELPHRKSSYSGSSSGCVSIAFAEAESGPVVGIQDSKLTPAARRAAQLAVPARSWAAFRRAAAADALAD
ncbi:DUF397 domain-containing protein [Saccharothrix hoggarensis]|uniref:DUF397 domain-containing protein n=1 Tax=Saccharothrix hoggarensis TaxID=913853 RepID=A0ABW3QMC6_9PSEU